MPRSLTSLRVLRDPPKATQTPSTFARMSLAASAASEDFKEVRLQRNDKLMGAGS